MIISPPSIERPPAAASRGKEAATTPSGVTGECGCHSHAWKMYVMAGMDVSGLGVLQEVVDTADKNSLSSFQKHVFRSVTVCR